MYNSGLANVIAIASYLMPTHVGIRLVESSLKNFHRHNNCQTNIWFICMTSGLTGCLGACFVYCIIVKLQGP
jgi:hypothetical protein